MRFVQAMDGRCLKIPARANQKLQATLRESGRNDFHVVPDQIRASLPASSLNPYRLPYRNL